MADSQWYVVHTYSGYENKVEANIKKIVENRGMHDLIDKVVVPVQDVIEVKGGRPKVTKRKVLPGYVLIKMVMNDDTWYVVRNTRGVTSFVGPGSKPVPLTEDEIANMGLEGGMVTLDLLPGQQVKIISGPLEGSIGVVEEIIGPKKVDDKTVNLVKIKLSAFGRDTFAELDFYTLQKL
ncbi:MAG: transcription termination/antitermination protein NusG [Defluviitaleaceae bacterium]|nr:transcription termination/antitermination protein NusG [Defluviitaleaceae bacterium]